MCSEAEKQISTARRHLKVLLRQLGFAKAKIDDVQAWASYDGLTSNPEVSHLLGHLRTLSDHLTRVSACAGVVERATLAELERVAQEAWMID